MRIGISNHGWWKGACDALKHDAVSVPVATGAGGNAYAADLAARLANGPDITEQLANRSADLLLDNGGTGLGFSVDDAGSLNLAHERAGKILWSHFIDPLVTAFQGLDWNVLWQCLMTTGWVKAMWDQAQVAELQRFGVPNVMHLAMAAPDRSYNTDPLDTKKCQPIVSFIGGQNTNYFAPGVQVPSNTLLAGTLAQAIRSDLPGVSFYDVYHDIYGLGAAVVDSDDLATRASKAMAYFNAKLFYNASLCIRNRDRFVIFLKRRLAASFYLAGSGWDTAYGLSTSPRLPTTDDYFNHFREVAINLNLVNGNAETGLNMRHFEITAAGGFMLCYYQPEIDQHFEVGKECVVFRNENELLEKINYYLAHADERAAIARAGQRRTLSNHLYSHRLQAVLGQLQSKKPPVEYSTTTLWEDLKSFVPDAKVVLDCGANVGQMASSFRNMYPDAEIYSFEPVTAAFEKLTKACESLRVHRVKKAVGDSDGVATINLTESPEANSLLGFQPGNPCAKWTRVVGQEQIEVCTLDRWCDETGLDCENVDLIKLDVQGAELQALQGATRLLKSAKAVYLEVSFVPIYQNAPLFGDIDAFLTERGYRRQAMYPSDQPQNWGDALYLRV